MSPDHMDICALSIGIRYKHTGYRYSIYIYNGFGIVI